MPSSKSFGFIANSSSIFFLSFFLSISLSSFLFIPAYLFAVTQAKDVGVGLEITGHGIVGPQRQPAVVARKTLYVPLLPLRKEEEEEEEEQGEEQGEDGEEEEQEEEEEKKKKKNKKKKKKKK